MLFHAALLNTISPCGWISCCPLFHGFLLQFLLFSISQPFILISWLIERLHKDNQDLCHWCKSHQTGFINSYNQPNIDIGRKKKKKKGGREGIIICVLHFKGDLLHHGPNSNRIYLLKLWFLWESVKIKAIRASFQRNHKNYINS